MTGDKKQQNPITQAIVLGILAFTVFAIIKVHNTCNSIFNHPQTAAELATDFGKSKIGESWLVRTPNIELFTEPPVSWNNQAYLRRVFIRKMTTAFSCRINEIRGTWRYITVNSDGTTGWIDSFVVQDAEKQ
jgi:hypothetical protein